MSQPALEVLGATKRFGAVTAVRDVSLTLLRGEVLAILGDNGAGKSTLIKVMSGVHQLDRGELRIEGAPRVLQSPQEARRHGIETVYQDLSLFDNLDVVANLFAGRELTHLGQWMRPRAMASAARMTLRDLEVNVPNPRVPVGLLSGGQRQAVAVARAADFATRVVILDEPTAALGVRETRNVLRLIKRLRGRGISVILVSHNLEQVMEVADRAVVLRGGVKVGELIPTAENHDRIVAMIVGASTTTA